MTKARLLFYPCFLPGKLSRHTASGAAGGQSAACLSTKPAATAPTHIAAAALPSVAQVTVNGPLTLTDNGDIWTMDNGIVKATIVKKNGSLLEVIYHGILRCALRSRAARTICTRLRRPLAAPSRPGYRCRPSRDPLGDHRPGDQRRARAEVAVRRRSRRRRRSRWRSFTGIQWRWPPWRRPDIETRYTMERGSSGIDVYAEFSHPASYPVAHVGESQIDLQLDPELQLVLRRRRCNTPTPATEDMRSGIMVHAPEQTILKAVIIRIRSSTSRLTAASCTGFPPGASPAPKITSAFI